MAGPSARGGWRGNVPSAGTSNIIAGAVGAGMTGSYIFSQTIFSMRAGVVNRLHGAIVAVMELALFFLPISVISYMPTFFYGEPPLCWLPGYALRGCFGAALALQPVFAGLPLAWLRPICGSAVLCCGRTSKLQPHGSVREVIDGGRGAGQGRCWSCSGLTSPTTG